ncbi:MAG: 5-(carboxyamino)imidazole ribonucleotide synthase [Gemmatimonadota bacterium]|nr:5-(carboxyamino)imidazole ribonucleotide synthase [Gemmatimonadota bacterium]
MSRVGPAQHDGIGKRVGVLGAGQLGQMLALAGIPLGVRFTFYSPTPSPSAEAVGDLVIGAYDDGEALRAFARSVDVVTYEFENVSAEAVSVIEAECQVWPPRDALFTSQDRGLEKQCFARLGIPVASYRLVDSLHDLEAALRDIGAPGILKTRRFGYDGKGQARIATAADAEAAFVWLGASGLVYERLITFERELSIIAVRAEGGEVRCYPPIQNSHRDGILRTSVAPADVCEAKRREAEDHVRSLLSQFDYVGVLALEMFDTADGLVANEIAPRVHNSGHWTIEGAETSQFENHVRAVCGMPLGSCAPVGHSVMVNIIGRHPDANSVLGISGAHLHLYGKTERAARKLGHVTVVAADADGARRAAEELCAIPLVDSGSAA